MRTLKWKRLRQWVIWIGGWEKANGEGWQFRTSDRSIFMPPWPISLLGHRFTFFGWGWQLRLSHPRRYLVHSKSGLYISTDGTPPRSSDNPKRGFFILGRGD